MNAEWVQLALIWNPDSSLTFLESPPGWVEARDLNDSGLAVGLAGNRPVRWSPAGELEELDHVVSLGWVHAISPAGAICGASDQPSGQAYTEAVVWEADGTFRALGALNEAGSDARDLNDAGEVVGWAGLILYGPRIAVHWDADGVMTDLNQFAPPGWELQEAVAINARGDIAGVCRDPEGVRQAFVLWRDDVAAAGPELGSPGGLGAGRPQAAPLRIWPNPSRGSVQLRLDAGVGGPALVQIFDPAGRLIGGFTSVLPAGDSVVVWDGRGAVERGASGLRLVRIRLPDGRAAEGRFVIVR